MTEFEHLLRAYGNGQVDLESLQASVELLVAESNGAATEALALSRGLAMATYRSREEFGKRFGTVPTRTAEGFRFPVEEYLFARGESFARPDYYAARDFSPVTPAAADSLLRLRD